MTTDQLMTPAQALAAATAAAIIPAVILCIIALMFNKRIDGRNPSFAASNGMLLRHVAACAMAGGITIGLAMLIPVYFEIAVCCGATSFAVLAGLITWNSRRAFSGALVTVAALGGGLALTLMLSQLVILAHNDLPATGQLAAATGSSWLLFGLPGLISALIVAIVSMQATPAEAAPTHAPASASAPLPHEV